MRILIVEDRAERQKALRNLVREHAWIMVHTSSRAIKLIEAYKFDMIFLDYDLAGPGKGDQIARYLACSDNADCKVIVHSTNHPGSIKIKEYLPAATLVPFSKMIRNNVTFKKLRTEISKGADIDWAYVFRDSQKL
jgi:CheY-like chemotaxis protein